MRTRRVRIVRFFVAARHCDGYTVRVILFPVVYYFSWISRLVVRQHRIDDVHLKIEIPIYKINVDGPTTFNSYLYYNQTTSV